MKLSPRIANLVKESMGFLGNPADTRVVCAMSGGVDSSVTAGLLKAVGFNVVGITLQLYDHGEAIRRKGACCAGQDIHDARRVAAQLDIPHYVLDFESRFKESVIDEFVDAYVSGATPIPCVRCNQTVKFADLFQCAKSLDASALVTGHYVESRAHGGGRAMFTPTDVARDQSYFLFATTTEQLSYLRFPLGQLTKDETRTVAQDMGLVVADKPDSQDICFVPDGDYASVIRKLRPDAARPGKIIDLEGHELGQHDGIIHYTIGQRKGLRLGGGEALFVVRLDAAKAEVIVGPRTALLQHNIYLTDVNWLDDVALSDEPQKIFARIRSTRQPIAATLRSDGHGAVLAIDEGEFGVSPGQAAVFYEGQGPGQRVLGGGFIASEIRRPVFQRSGQVALSA